MPLSLWNVTVVLQSLEGHSHSRDYSSNGWWVWGPGFLARARAGRLFLKGHMVNILGLVGIKVFIVSQNCCCSRRTATVICKPMSVAVFCEAEFTRKARHWLVDPSLEGKTGIQRQVAYFITLLWVNFMLVYNVQRRMKIMFNEFSHHELSHIISTQLI